jgi:hypothetical protein
MAIYNGYNLSQIALGKKLPGGEINGRVKVLHEKFTLTAELLVADEILGPKIPAGAKVLDAYVAAPSLGATGIVTLGHKASLNYDGSVAAEDADAFVASADFGGAAALVRAGVSGKEAGILKRFSAVQETQTFLSCTELTAAGTGLEVEYVITFTLD